MDEKLFDELAGRIDGVGQALLRLTAALEMQGVIDGPLVSEGWRGAVRRHTAGSVRHHSAYKLLQALADSLEAARNSRQAWMK
jgi:hypothetical protein